jgi:hypothetical protein
MRCGLVSRADESSAAGGLRPSWGSTPTGSSPVGCPGVVDPASNSSRRPGLLPCAVLSANILRISPS